ncbi:MAG: PaaI family thioesterase [Pseudomonadota bacterium]
MPLIDPPLPGYTIYDPVDPFENRAGPFWWGRKADGSRHFVLRAEDRHCNTHGILHGGLMMTMIDLTLVAIAKKEPSERFVTVSLNSEFVAAASTGDLIEAQGTLVRRTRSLAFVRGEVTSGDTVLLTASAVLKSIGPQ